MPKWFYSNALCYQEADRSDSTTQRVDVEKHRANQNGLAVESAIPQAQLNHGQPYFINAKMKWISMQWRNTENWIEGLLTMSENANNKHYTIQNSEGVCPFSMSMELWMCLCALSRVHRLSSQTTNHLQRHVGLIEYSMDVSTQHHNGQFQPECRHEWATQRYDCQYELLCRCWAVDVSSQLRKWQHIIWFEFVPEHDTSAG